jgi:hypothetical protein
LTHLRTQETVLVVVLALLLSSAGAFAQEQLSPEKKKELRKFDPADIVPEAREGEPKVRESQDGRGQVGVEGTRSRRNARTSTLAAPVSAAVDSTLPAPPEAPAAKAPGALRATPSLAPKGAVVLTQSAAPKTQSSETAASGAPAPATAVNRSARSARLSLPLISFLLGLILLALVAVALKLKKDLSKL